MGKRTIPCNLTETEIASAWEEFDTWLDQQEEEMVAETMEHFLFYTTEYRGSKRECICTHSNCGKFEMWKRYEKEFFNHKHGDEISCPVCGKQVKLMAMGRFQNFGSLNDLKWKRVTICRTGNDGALLLLSGYAHRYFSWDDLKPVPEISWKAFTYLKPGKRMQWERVWMPTKEEYWAYQWQPRSSVMEPFQPGGWGWDHHDGDSWFLNTQAIDDSALKYCQLEEWMYQDSRVYMSGEDDPVRMATKYLAAYSQYPQIEMAVKMGLSKPVSELIRKGRKNHKDLNWKATTLPEFLRLNKPDAKAFLHSSGDFQVLISYHTAKKRDMVSNMQEFVTLLVHAGGLEYARRLTDVAMQADCTIRVAANYAGKIRCRMSTGEFLTLWKDYLNMAVILGYDMTRRDVVMPKNLQERHDAASETIRYQKVTVDEEKYKAFNTYLRKMYEFEFGDLCIMVPGSVEEIVAEGKTLKHCVGGYAARHFDNKVTILFMRHKRRPHVPWITMEILPRTTMKDNIIIKQIHGYKNELYQPSGGKKPARPSDKYRWFLDIWKAWVKAGSKRDKKGKPVLPKSKEKTA